MNRLRCLLISCVLASCWVLATGMPSAEAGTVVFGNFGPNGDLANSTTVSFQVGVAPGDTNQALAIPFQTGANPLFLQLQSVTFSFGQAQVGTNPSIGIFTNNGGNPGTQLAALSGPAINATQKYEWSPASLLQLDPGAQYFVVVKELNASIGFNWYMADDEDVAGPQNGSGWFRPFAPRKSTNGGTSWGNSASSERNVGISVVAVPEPSSMALAAAGLVAAACLCIRRSSRRTTPALS